MTVTDLAQPILMLMGHQVTSVRCIVINWYLKKYFIDKMNPLHNFITKERNTIP